LIKDFTKEHFIGFYLDSNNNIIESKVISIGDDRLISINPTDIFRPEIACGAKSVIFVHNHPNGNHLPSMADNIATKKLKEIGDLLDIVILDHIILGSKKHYSYNDQFKL